MTDDDLISQELRSRIQTEERYRNEVQKQLETKSELRWKRANSPIVVTFLAGVLTVGLTWFISWMYETSNKNDERRTTIVKLCNELEWRIFVRKEHEKSTYANWFAILDGGQNDHLHADYTSRGFVSLLWELQTRIEDKKQKKLLANYVTEWSKKKSDALSCDKDKLEFCKINGSKNKENAEKRKTDSEALTQKLKVFEGSFSNYIQNIKSVVSKIRNKYD